MYLARTDAMPGPVTAERFPSASRRSSWVRASQPRPRTLKKELDRRSEIVIPEESDTVTITARDIFPDPV